MAFILEEEKPETFREAVPRHVARAGARGAESIAGMPGDLQSLMLLLGQKGAQAIGIPEEVIQKVSHFAAPLGIFGKVPTSEEIKEQVTEPLTGEYLKPRTKVERISDDIVSDASVMLMPVKAKVPKSAKAFKHIFRALGTAAGANLASETVGLIGGGPTAQTASKLGAMLVLGVMRRGSPKKAVNLLYKEAEGAIKGRPRVKALELDKSLTKLEIKLRKGLEAPSEKAVLKSIEGLRKKMRGGTIQVEEIWSSKRSINEEISRALFETPGKAAKARARKLFTNVNKELNKELGAYGKKNPKFGKAFKEAEEAHGALAQSQVIGNFIKKHAKSKATSGISYALIHGGLALGAKAAVGTGLAATAYKTGQVGYRLAKSSALRKHYMEVLKAAAKQNVGAMNKAIQKLEKESREEEKKTPSKRFILQD